MTLDLTPVAVLSATSATCALCHTVNHTVTEESMMAGVRWSCARCGQKWTAARLETATAYLRSIAVH